MLFVLVQNSRETQQNQAANQLVWDDLITCDSIYNKAGLQPAQARHACKNMALLEHACTPLRLEVRKQQKITTVLFHSYMHGRSWFRLYPCYFADVAMRTFENNETECGSC